MQDCGVFAVYSLGASDEVYPYLYLGMQYIQHRGQDAAGVAVSNGKDIAAIKGLGLVSHVLRNDVYKDLKRNVANAYVGIGHTRYPTTGYYTEKDVQPIICGNNALAHNGHVTNYNELKEELINKGVRIKTNVDSEVILEVFRQGNGSIEEKVKHVMETIDGAYATVMIYDGKLVCFRDPLGIRPLVFGKKKSGNKEIIMFASESCALEVNGVNEIKDVLPGEAIIISKEEIRRIRIIKKKKPAYCMFEYVYFSRPDSTINEKFVMDVRKRLGKELAKEAPANADVVIPVPDTSRPAAKIYGEILGMPVEEGLIKNRYIGRTFIMPTQEARRRAVRQKLNPVRRIINGKRVVLVDDSIVRATTIKEIVELVRGAGAKEIHVRITCPPIKAPCFYGIYIPTYKELIASNKTVEEIAKYINVDSLKYLSIDGLKRAIGLDICTACLGNNYPTEGGERLSKDIRKGKYDRA